MDKQEYEFRKDLIHLRYGHNQTYATVILAIGYAGIFTLWAFAQEYLQPWQVLSSATLLLVSISTFVLFEVYKIFQVSKETLEADEILSELQDFEDKRAEFIKRRENELQTYGRLWKISFRVTFLTGVGAIAILLVSFVEKLCALFA